jgi:hypothetical protein
MKRLYSYLILSLFCVAFVGCGRYFAPDRNVKETLVEKDVIGKWRLKTSSSQLLVRDGFRSDPTNRCTIMFNADGTCFFHSVESFGGTNRYFSGGGTWRLEHDTQGDSNIKKKNAVRLELPVNGERKIQYWNFAKEKGVLILWNSYGDPDEWEFLEYERDG